MTGSKRLAEVEPPSSATCSPFSDGVFVDADNLATVYTATINGVQGSTGTATVSMLGTLGADGVVLPPVFSENFASNGATLTGPTRKDQCKHGGWRSFGGLFKNQGQCVSFVEHQHHHHHHHRENKN